MVALLGLLTPLALAITAASAPAQTQSAANVLKLPVIPVDGLLCKLPIVKNVFCAVKRNTTLSVSTPAGTATGVADGDAFRFVVTYGTAARWAESSPAKLWALPNNLTDPAGSPLTCPQYGADPSTYSEDCLSLILYVPKTVSGTAKSNVPAILWVHGGSFAFGSATDAGLDGSKLAVATNTIVAVVQYRLGGFGWVTPNGAQNLGVKDVVTAMTFLNRVLPSFGGAANKITLAGQSAGATLIRSLLAAPSAASLFQSAILQSDPMDYGFFTPTTQTALNNDFISNLDCSGTDTKCLSSLSVETILDAADTVRWDAPSLDPAASGGEWFRPVTDGSFITSPLDSTAAFPKQTKPILVTNVAEEAAYTIYGPDGFTDPVPPSVYVQAVSATYSEDSTNKILNSSFYGLPEGMSKDASADTRPQLEILGTDGVWRCAGWTFARNWVNAGARVYVGMFTVGASYPGNSDASACTVPGVVCHQDDIEIVFGTVDNPTAAQSKAIVEVQARWGAFVKTGSPNPSGYQNWPQATTTDVKTIMLGNNSGTAAPVGGCTPDFWGTAVPYDYQVYGL